MKPDYQSDKWAIYVADCIEIMNGMPEGVVDLAVFSPPFSDLFVYSDSERDMGNCGSSCRVPAPLTHWTWPASSIRVLKPGRDACDPRERYGLICQNSRETGEGGLMAVSTTTPARPDPCSRCGGVRVSRTVHDLERSQSDRNAEDDQGTERLLYKNSRRKTARVSAIGMPDYILVLAQGIEGASPSVSPSQHDPRRSSR
jgi:hypothetical protein